MNASSVTTNSNPTDKVRVLVEMTAKQWASNGMIQTIIKGAAGFGITIRMLEPGTELTLREFHDYALEELSKIKDQAKFDARQLELLARVDVIVKAIMEAKP